MFSERFEATSEGPDGRGFLKGLSTQISYDQRRFQLPDGSWVRDFEIRLRLKPGTGIGRGDVASLRQHLSEAANRHVNDRYELPGGDKLNVTLIFDSPTPHGTVTVHGAAHTNQQNFSVHAPSGVLAHEILHYLGLPEGYHHPESLLNRAMDPDGPMGEYAARGEWRLSAEQLAKINEVANHGPVHDLAHDATPLPMQPRQVLHHEPVAAHGPTPAPKYGPDDAESDSSDSAPGRSYGTAVLRVPGDGWCLLYSVLASTPAEHWPVTLSESVGDAPSAHAAVLEQLRQPREPGVVGEDTPLYRSADALRQKVLHMVRDGLPSEVEDHYRRSADRMHRVLQEFEHAPADELRLRLRSLGVVSVRSSHWMHPNDLRAQYIGARTQQLVNLPNEPRVSEVAARAQAESEVEQRVDERTGARVLTDAALGIQEQFDYLDSQGVRLSLDLVAFQGLKDAFAETMAERPLDPDERRQLADRLNDMLNTWRPGTAAWNTEDGEMFPALVAHAMGMQLRVRSIKFGTATAVGPVGTGRSVDVHYNGNDHYDASEVQDLESLAKRERERERTAERERAERERRRAAKSERAAESQRAERVRQAHVAAAVSRALGLDERVGRARDVEEGGAHSQMEDVPAPGAVARFRGRAWEASTLHEDISQHHNQEFFDLLGHLTDPRTKHNVVAGLRDRLNALGRRVADSPVPSGHERAHRVMRRNAGRLIERASNAARVLGTDRDPRWWHTALTASGLLVALGEPYIVPTLSKEPNYVGALVAADTKILPRLIGMARHPRADRRLLIHYLQDSALLWWSELPYLIPLIPHFAYLNGSPPSDTSSEPGSDVELVQTSASKVFTAVATLFALGWFITLGYGPALWHWIGNQRSDQRALNNGELALPSEGDRQEPSEGDRRERQEGQSRWADRDGMVLTREEFVGRVEEIVEDFRLIDETSTEFQQHARISENLATQIGFVRDDLRSLQELAEGVQGRPRQRIGVGEYLARAYSSDNPELATKLAFLGAHVLPHSAAMGAGWLLNSPSGGSATADAFYAFLRAGEVALDPEKTTADAKQIFNNLTSEILGNTPIDVAVIVNHAFGRPDFWENPVAQGLLITYLGMFSASYAGWTGEKIADGVNWGVNATPSAWRGMQHGTKRAIDYVRTASGLWAPPLQTQIPETLADESKVTPGVFPIDRPFDLAPETSTPGNDEAEREQERERLTQVEQEQEWGRTAPVTEGSGRGLRRDEQVRLGVRRQHDADHDIESLDPPQDSPRYSLTSGLSATPETMTDDSDDADDSDGGELFYDAQEWPYPLRDSANELDSDSDWPSLHRAESPHHVSLSDVSDTPLAGEHPQHMEPSRLTPRDFTTHDEDDEGDEDDEDDEDDEVWYDAEPFDSVPESASDVGGDDQSFRSEDQSFYSGVAFPGGSEDERSLARPHPVTSGPATAIRAWAGLPGQRTLLVSVAGVAAPVLPGLPVATVHSDASDPGRSSPE